MNFQIHPLPIAEFSHLFDLPDEQLLKFNARRITATSKPGMPCRVSLCDAEIGETVILANYQHQKEATPFQSSHAIYIRENAREAQVPKGQIPDLFRSPVISIRAFDEEHMIIDADICEGTELEKELERMLGNANVSYIHLHWAKHGCFAARVTRADL